jgi:hypothetical protein
MPYALVPPSVLGQTVTFREAFPVATYPDVPALVNAMARLKWTEDPLGGCIDMIRHPRYMQEAIERHPDKADDCDGFAAYAAVALLKSKLASLSEVFWATAFWVNPKTDAIDGHAVCVFRQDNEWRWMSNWDHCKPFTCGNGPMATWVEQLETRANVKVFVAAVYPAKAGEEDTLLLEPGRFLRR